MENKTLKTVQRILVIAVAFFTFNALSFPLILEETGFLMVAFSAYEIEGIAFICFLCWLQFLYSLVAIALSIISIFIKKESTVKKLNMMILIGGVAFSFLYMLEAIIEAAIIEEPMTTAFVPFFLNTALMITYFLLPKFAKNMTNNNENYLDYSNVGHEESNANVYNANAYNASADNTDDVSFVGENPTINNQTVPSKNKDIDSILFSIKNYIPDEKVMSLHNAIQNSKATDLSFLNMVPLKNPTTVLLFSIFLGGFGIDRFYIGDTGLGVAKLLLSGLTFGIWPLVDIFLCYNKAKEYNYNNLLSKLGYNNFES